MGKDEIVGTRIRTPDLFPLRDFVLVIRPGIEVAVSVDCYGKQDYELLATKVQ
jgi:hypothetical protein